MKCCLALEKNIKATASVGNRHIKIWDTTPEDFDESYQAARRGLEKDREYFEKHEGIAINPGFIFSVLPDA